MERHDRGQRMDQVRRVSAEPAALEECVADQPNASLLEIAKAAVDELRAAAGCAFAEVVLLEERDAIAAGGRIDRHANARGAAADHDDVPRLVVAFQSLDLRLAGEVAKGSGFSRLDALDISID